MADQPTPAPQGDAAATPQSTEGQVLASPYATYPMTAGSFSLAGSFGGGTDVARLGFPADVALGNSSKDEKGEGGGPLALAMFGGGTTVADQMTGGASTEVAKSGAPVAEGGKVVARDATSSEAAKPTERSEAQLTFNSKEEKDADLVINADGTHSWKDGVVPERKASYDAFVKEGTSKANQIKAITDAKTELQAKGVNLKVDLATLPDRSSSGGGDKDPEGGGEDGEGDKDNGENGGGGGGCDNGGGGGGGGGGGQPDSGENEGKEREEGESEEGTVTPEGAKKTIDNYKSKLSNELNNPAQHMNARNFSNFAHSLSPSMFTALQGADKDGDGKISDDEWKAFLESEDGKKAMDELNKKTDEKAQAFEKDGQSDAAQSMKDFAKGFEKADFRNAYMDTMRKGATGSLTAENFQNNAAFSSGFQKATALQTMTNALDSTNSGWRKNTTTPSKEVLDALRLKLKEDTRY
jgi:hypothetical protein